MMRDQIKTRRRGSQNGPRVVPTRSGLGVCGRAAVWDKPRPAGFAPPARAEVAILAGGLSTRMGRDKARLRLGGRTLLARIKAVAAQTRLPVRVIRRDLVPRCGPLGGVHAALKTTSADIVLFLSCDMPFVSGRLLTDLRRRLRPRSLAVFCVTEEGSGFPFVMRRAALSFVEAQLEERRFSLQLLAARLNAGKYRPARAVAGELVNVNTPEEWAVARARWRGRFGKRGL